MSNEESVFEFETDGRIMEERYELALNRIRQVSEEKLSNSAFNEFFHGMADFLALMDDTLSFVKKGGLYSADIEELAKLNKQIYEDILPENYDESFGNPAYAVKELGDDFGRLLSALCYEMRAMIRPVFEQNMFEIVVGMELFLEIYGAFLSADAEGTLPSYESVRQIMYWYYSDYAEDFRTGRFGRMVDPVSDYARNIITGDDLTDLRYLYRYGDYITDNELKTAEHLNSLPEDEINKMADTYTEGYRIGFAMTGKDITIKKTAQVVYHLGFERMMKRAVQNFKDIGLECSTRREGGDHNRQFEYDHKDDIALFLDHNLVNRKLEAVKAAGEKFKAKARLFGGPAVIEVFGEKPFSPVPKKEAVHPDKSQNELLSELKNKAALIQNEYIIGKERSFTIISFPLPEIGDNYEEIFDEVVKINTLDYKLYQRIQQVIVDALDEAKYCIVKGMGDNRTDMKVMLRELGDRSKETNFENCVADVNIPVGEVFTSPRLTGTEGTLHVTGVYLEGLFFKNLEIKFKDGCITDYSCSNFESEEENRRYIDDNILFNHKTLPIGEFAIGTNTTAYTFARKFDIADRLPILIAEKTGPHFAVGDTCYSHEEDNVTYNPDGKAIVARDNEISAKRNTDPDKAYFSCHTDITIPYDELGEIRAVREDGSSIVIIEKGRFVLPGTEELNEALDETV